MRAREFVREQAPTTPPGTVPGNSQSAEPQDVGKLTATINDLQKQVGELQKAALQQAETPVSTPTPVSTAPTTTQGTVGTTVQPQTQQPATQVKSGTPMGQQPPAGQAEIKPTTPVKTPPAVSQPSQITNMKIKQQMAQNQSGGTK